MNGELQLPPGFRFQPTDEELVKHYLCTKCASQPIAVPIIKEIDLYKFDPWQLPGAEHLEELVSVIMQRIGYYNDEGDKILLETDGDFVAAVNYARSIGVKALNVGFAEIY
ncbi:hypothetical protein K1719_046434 [Acacia pycnantha]|nr:hypothetical protein K1719_046434 [Acacia pycnantha]